MTTFIVMVAIALGVLFLLCLNYQVRICGLEEKYKRQEEQIKYLTYKVKSLSKSEGAQEER